MNEDSRVKTISARVDARLKSFVESAVEMGDAKTKSDYIAEAVVWRLQRENVPERIHKIMKALELKHDSPDLFSALDEMEAGASNGKSRERVRSDGDG